MKRSEAIQLLKDMLNSGYDPLHTDTDAEQFLTRIEQEIGMIPPLTVKRKPAKKSKGLDIMASVNEWDEE